MGKIKEETAGWLNKAKSALLAAESLRERGFLSESISRGYYAMFYAAEAFLWQEKQVPTADLTKLPSSP